MWSGDLELCFQDRRPYVSLLTTISALTNQGVFLETIEERWFDQNDSIEICITYTCGGRGYKIWTKRLGDFLNTHILCLLNRQACQSGYEFEYAAGLERIYYINAMEKIVLESHGVIFQPLDAVDQFEFLLYNATKNLEAGENEFAYMLIRELAQVAEKYYERRKHMKNIKAIQQMIKVDLFEKISWQKISDMGVDIEPLHALAYRVAGD